MAETVKCPRCGAANDPAARECSSSYCGFYLKSAIETLWSIDGTLKTIKGIAIWWLILSILGVAGAVIYVVSVLSRMQ